MQDKYLTRLSTRTQRFCVSSSLLNSTLFCLHQRKTQALQLSEINEITLYNSKLGMRLKNILIHIRTAIPSAIYGFSN